MSESTSIDYALPVIFATEYVLVFEHSANMPILVRGVDKDKHIKGDYVTKLKSYDRMADPASSIRELLAAFMAMEMGIPTIKPAIIELSKDFIATIQDDKVRQIALSSIGYNFGSAYEANYQIVSVGKLSDKLLPYAQDIFAFDILIHNADRNIIKPNMLTNGEEIIILDHEAAFGFTFAPFISANIWEMQDRDKKWITDHFFYHEIKGKNYDYDSFSLKLATLNDSFWDRAWNLLPSEWQLDQFNTIKRTIKSFVENKDKLIQELKFIML